MQAPYLRSRIPQRPFAWRCSSVGFAALWVTIAKTNFRARVINTINGAIVACLALLVFGANFAAMLVAMTVSVLIAMSLQNYPPNWRLAPNTTVVLMAAALTGHGLSEEIGLAMMRVAEVLTGSTVALMQTLAYGYLLRR